ncbi:MAG TPA: hypothetical protein VNJ01_03725 [Bacteriovoracaceae bacterium]|nr:hypothetical protein [Bacteriovoracaceae bacterium]
MMDHRQLTHDIMNMLERLRIMHDLAIKGNFQDISREEMVKDLEVALATLKEKFAQLLQ